MKILITGGAGFIGSAVVRHILNNSLHYIVNVDKLTYAGNLESISLASGHKRYQFEQVDICDSSAIERIFNEHQPDAVMHLAAETHVDRSIDGPAPFIETNIVGTFTLLTCAYHYWQHLPQKRQNQFRFHHVSTDEVYGDLPHPDHHPQAHLSRFTEQNAYDPSSPYSASKASADHLVRAWHRTYGLPVIISNCSNNYGPYQFPEKFIPHMIMNALSGKPLPIYGDGSQIRDWLYVEDHARALLCVLLAGGVGQTYNIGGNTEKRNVEVVQILCSLLEELAPKKPEGVIKYQDLITYVADRPGHDQRYAIDTRKIRCDLGWKPHESFASGIRKTLEWYLQNQAWWHRVYSGEYPTKSKGINT